MYALALAAPRPSADSRARLTLLLGGNSKIDDPGRQSRDRLWPAFALLPPESCWLKMHRRISLLLLSPGDSQSSATHAEVLLDF